MEITWKGLNLNWSNIHTAGSRIKQDGEYSNTRQVGLHPLGPGSIHLSFLKDAALLVSPSLLYHHSLLSWIISLSVQRFSSMSQLKTQTQSLWFCSFSSNYPIILLLSKITQLLSCGSSLVHFLIFSSLLNSPQMISTLSRGWNCSIHNHQWPPFPKFGR